MKLIERVKFLSGLAILYSFFRIHFLSFLNTTERENGEECGRRSPNADSPKPRHYSPIGHRLPHCSQRSYKPPFPAQEALKHLDEEARNGWRDRELTYEFIRMIENHEPGATVS